MALPTAIAGADVTVAEGALPVSQAFTGVASTPGAGGAVIAGYAWTLLDKPVGSAAALADAATATPTLNNADLHGNFRLFLVVTDDVGGVSQSNPLLAPDTAFVHLRVTGADAGLQKLAIGERNTAVPERAVVEAVEVLRHDVDDMLVQDLADVASPTSTGPNLDRLTSATWATDDGTATGVPLHFHSTDTIGPATTTGLGAVLLAESPDDPANPTVPAQDRLILCGQADGTHTVDGYLPGKVAVVTEPTRSEAHLHWVAPCALTIVSMTASFADGGAGTPPAWQGYRAAWYVLSAADFRANNWAGATATNLVSLAAAAPNHAPVTLAGGAMSVAVAAGQVVAFRITTAPALIVDTGSGLSVTLDCRRV